MKLFHQNKNKGAEAETYDGIVTANNIVLLAQAAPQWDDCAGCAFDNKKTVNKMRCSDTPYCADTSRDDNCNVIWVKQTN